jgi:hypothetical protein
MVFSSSARPETAAGKYIALIHQRTFYPCPKYLEFLHLQHKRKPKRVGKLTLTSMPGHKESDKGMVDVFPSSSFSLPPLLLTQDQEQELH